jgi:protein-disulfide isomerase
MHRRRFLATTGTLALAGLAGCTGGSEPTTETETSADATTTDTVESSGSGGRSIDQHPAATGLDAQPVRGELGGNVIVAFEDPSCPRCRAFETGTVPRIESELVETGQAAYVYRNYPVIYPWGKPATQALEATFDRRADAFWRLVRHYYRNQSTFTTDNVLDETAAFLNDETDVDGDAVAADAEAKRFDSAVQADLDAGEAADVGRTTPTIFLFRDGEYVTKASGSISYEVVATALGVA